MALLEGPLSDSVVDAVARRYDLDGDQARARAEDTVRLARAADRAGAGPDDLPPLRRERLVRAAKARLYLTEVFEPAHGPENIPADDPLLQREARGFRYVRKHPVAAFCQLVVAPAPEPDDYGQAPLPTSFYERAAPVAATLESFLAPLVPVGTDQMCPTLRDLARFVPKAYAPGVSVRYEAGAVDLGVCAEEAPDGTCARPFLDPDWEAAVAAAEAPSRLPPVRTRFGVHLVFLHEKLPPAPPDDPNAQAALRRGILTAYRARELGALLDRLRKTRTVRMVGRLPGEP